MILSSNVGFNDAGSPDTCIWQYWSLLEFGNFILHFVIGVPHQKIKAQSATVQLSENSNYL